MSDSLFLSKIRKFLVEEGNTKITFINKYIGKILQFTACNL